MNPITSLLQPGMQGSAVADLQDALLLLIEKGRIRLPPPLLTDTVGAVRDEREAQIYGESTARVVKLFRGTSHPGEDVDEPTAKALNAALKEVGAFGEATSEQQRVVAGQVTREDGRALTDCTVRAYHVDDQSTLRLGEDITDTEGRYTIRYDLPPGLASVNLRVTASDGNDQLLQSSQIFRDARPLESVDLVVQMTGRPTEEHRLEGRIMFEKGLAAENLTLRLYRLDFGGVETQLVETITRELGLYVLPFELGGKAAGLEIRAVDATGKEVPLCKPIHDFGDEARIVVNLVAPATLQPLAAEFQRLTADLTPHVGEMKNLANAREDAERQDLTVLNRATGWDARLIALAANASALSADPKVGLSQEALYGLFRAGLPSDKLQLARVTVEAVDQALRKLKELGIINLSDEQVTDVKTKFNTFARETRLTIPAPGSSSTYGDLLKASGLSDDIQAKFASVYFGHRGNGEQLWDEARKAGLDDAHIGKLQLQGKLAFLAGNSQAMTTALMQKQIDDPAQLVDQDFHRADQWKAEARALASNDQEKLGALIPPVYTGEKVDDRLNAYAEDMARKVRLSYPTHVVGRMIEQGEIKLPDAHDTTLKLLKSASKQGFRLGQTPVKTFLKTHADVTAGIAENELRAAEPQMRTLQCVYQITPSNESMPVLINLGMTSAYDVLAYSEEEFVAHYASKYYETYGHIPTQEESQLIYRKAQQVNSVTYNLFTIAKKLDSEAPLFAISPAAEVRERVKNELIKHFPTMESLFGSMDFCECEHCRSVLSPAAYLVDLLQFVDAEPQVWDNFLADWKDKHNGQDYTAKYKKPYDALIERRPDIPHIPLTCENTNTALPYIDVVNEILEYYVANGKLDDKVAHDTGDATTAELLAEPQNVVAEAYNKVQQARYPLNLPFDLWIETVRHFCDYFETPLWRLLETFREGDELFAPAQSYDRAVIFIESLGLSPAEYAIFTDPTPLAKWYELYGYDTAGEATTVATDADTGQRIDLNSAKALSRRLGVTYKEIAEIVQTGFVNPQLEKLGLLYKLGVSIRDARFYLDHKNDPAPVSTEDQKRRLEVEAFAAGIGKLAQRFNVSTEELEAELQAIPFDGVLVLADPDAGCDFNLTSLRYANGDPADAIAFLKINLFVRLWRKLGWAIEETDRTLCTLIPESAPFDKDPANLGKQPLKTALIYLAHLKTLDEKLHVGKQSHLKLITFWSDIAATGKKPLYAQLFLTRSVLKSDLVFDDPLGKYLSPARIAIVAKSRKHKVQLAVPPAEKIDPAPFAGHAEVQLWYDELQEVQHLTYDGVLSDADKAALMSLSPSAHLPALLDAVQEKAKEFTLIKGHLLVLEGALGLTANEIGRILEDAGKSLDAAELSLPNVSILYRYALLTKALKLSVLELLALKQLSGLDPFKLLHSDPLTALAQDYPFTQTLRFIELAEKVKESGLSIEDLDYLLRHRFDETGKYRPNRESTLALLKTLSEGVRAIRTEDAAPDDPAAMSDEVLGQKLGLALPPDVVERFLAMISGTAEFTATKTGVEPVDELKPGTFADEPTIREVSYKEVPNKEQKLTVRGVLFADQKTALETRFSTALSPVQRSVFTELLGGVQTRAKEFFAKNLQKQAPDVQPTTGFLDAADFALLFDPSLALAPGETAQDRIRSRRAKLANAFLPFLQERLIRQFIVQTMTAHTGADPVLVESLLIDERLLGSPKPLLEALSATGERGITATYGEGAAAVVVSQGEANTAVKDKDGKPLKPTGANSARFEGYLEVPIPGAYRFYVALDKQGAEAELRFDHLSDPLFWSGAAAADNVVLGDKPEQYLELKPGVPYRFALYLRKLNGGEARMLVQGETLPKDSLSELVLYPSIGMDGAERAVLLLTKALQLLLGLGLTEREARYLLTYATAFDNLDLRKLAWRDAQRALETIVEKKREANPTLTKEQAILQARSESLDLGTEADQITPLFNQLLRLAGYSHLKRNLSGGTDDLIGIFEANGTGDLDKVYSLIAKLARRDETTVKSVANALFTAPAFTSEKPLGQLWEALQIVERFGVPVASLLEWTRIASAAVTPEQRFEIARDLKEAIKARFEPETWQGVAQSIFDNLRQRQRDALVAHVMHQHGFARIEQLYEYFLIDPGMEPVVQTSRIRLAIASLQLFIQRCLLNMEPQVHPSVVNSKQWEWMKRYRVWEANRKIFLFPENWLDPEFRDDKTHLFRELEGALLQGDVSRDLVEDAFLTYLKKLEELARLDIVAMHLEDKSDPALNTLHVIGRTYSEPHKYFYRRYANQMWTPWEPVTAEIEGDHVAPVMWRDRLYLFWVTFLETGDSDAMPAGSSGSRFGGIIGSQAARASGVDVAISIGAEKDASSKVTDMTLADVARSVKSVAATKIVKAQLHWTEYIQGEWSMRESGGFGASLSAKVPSTFDNKSVFIHVSKDGGENGVKIHLGGSINQAFYLAGRNSIPKPLARESEPVIPYSQTGVRANRYSGSGALTVNFAQRVTTEDGKPPVDTVETSSILQQGGSYTLLTCDNAITLGTPEIASLVAPFFYQDHAEDTLFGEPSLTEKTIEEWQEWVTQTPEPEVGWDRPDWLKDFVRPAVPKPKLAVPIDPGDPVWRLPIDPESCFKVKPGQDWLVNPATAFQFNGEVIGPGGRAGLAVLSSVEVAGAHDKVITPVNIHAGSGLATDSTIIATEHNALELAGLTHAAGGLNVVGGGGLNSSLLENLHTVGRHG